MSKHVLVQALHLVFFTVSLPSLLTFAHLRHYIESTAVSEPTCWIKTHDGVFEGAYSLNPTAETYVLQSESQLLGQHTWPSIVSVASALKQRQNRMLYRQNSGNVQIKHENNQWCVSQDQKMIACSPPAVTSSMLPTGNSPSRWKRLDTTGENQFLQVLCFDKSRQQQRQSWFRERSLPENDTTQKESLLQGVRKNPNKQRNAARKKNQLLDFIQREPATLLLMAINIGLAVVYWNWRVNPSNVAKVYSKILYEHEIWRSFSGATAHFDGLHIGFNMMSLYTLGQELEFGVYQSIEFFLYNVSLIPLTTTVFMALVYARINWEASDSHAHTSTVGYSGVLFAWMVVSCLERDSTCPIPMMTDVCFDTHDLWGFKFNISPMVQLMIAQVIMKRVSFLGHLSGIIIGFLLHWKLLPLEYIQPVVLLPFILVLHYSLGRSPPLLEPPTAIARFLPGNSPQQEEEVELSDSQWGIRQVRRRDSGDDDELFHTAIMYLRNAMLVVLLVGVQSFGIIGSITWSYLWVTVLFWCAVNRNRVWLKTVKDGNINGKQLNDETDRLNTVYKGFIVTSIVLIVGDSMNLSGWIALWWTRRIFFWNNGTAWTVVLMLWVARILIQLLALCFVSKHVYDLDESGGGGSFVAFFGWSVLDNAKTIGRTAFKFLSSRDQSQYSHEAFAGRGIVLGSGGSDSQEDTRQCRLDGEQSHLL